MGYSEYSCGVLCVRTRGTLSTHARLQNDQSETWLYRDMAASAMDALPNNSIVICQGRRQNNTKWERGLVGEGAKREKGLSGREG